MSFFNINKNKNDSELQSELRALVQRCIAQPSAIYSEGKRYEKLLEELYNRNIEPVTTLIREKI